jgi:hypothetical protein
MNRRHRVKILTATTQGADHEDDFSAAVEGEIVVEQMICDNPNCGCDRSFGGLNSHSATTTVMVRDVDLSVAELEEAAIGFLESSGWAKLMRDYPDPDDGPDPVREMARSLVEDSAAFAADFDEGKVLRMSFDRASECWTFY